MKATTGSDSQATAGGLAGRGVFQWWLDELAGLVPPPVKRLFLGAPDRLALCFGEDELTIQRSVGGVWQTRGTFAPQSEDGPRRAAALVRAPAKDGVILVLPGGRAISRTITLPLAAEAELERALSFEIERHTPLQADQACFTHKIVGRDRASGMLTVDITVVARDLVDGLITEATRLGLAPTAVVVSDAVGFDRLAQPGALDRYDLLRGRQGAASSGYQVRHRVLAALFVAGLIAAAASPVLQLSLALDDMQQRLPEARQRAESVLAIESRIEALERQSAEMIGAKDLVPSPVRVLEAISAALPDDTWLTFLSLGNGQLIIEGRSPSAAALVRRLESVSGFGKVGFGAPVTRNAADGLEHFQFVIAMPAPGAKAP